MLLLKDRPTMADAVRWLVTEGKADTFVETGTGKGDTALWAGHIFSRVYTIEEDLETFRTFFFRRTGERFQRAKVKNRDLPITQLFGDSRSVLPENVFPSLEGHTPVFWLDAHRVTEPTGSPVLAEVTLIREWGKPCVILIDDYTLFTLQPKDKKEQSGWPNVFEILKLLKGLDVRICDDIIVAVDLSACTAKDIIYSKHPYRMEAFDHD